MFPSTPLKISLQLRARDAELLGLGSLRLGEVTQLPPESQRPALQGLGEGRNDGEMMVKWWVNGG